MVCVSYVISIYLPDCSDGTQQHVVGDITGVMSWPDLQPGYKKHPDSDGFLAAANIPHAAAGRSGMLSSSSFLHLLSRIVGDEPARATLCTS